jgi:hypothetical protein
VTWKPQPSAPTKKPRPSGPTLANRNRAGVQLPLGEALAGAEQEREVGAEAERGELPPAGRMPGELEDDGREQGGRDDRVGEAPGS